VTLLLPADSPLAAAILTAIRTGELEALHRLLLENPELVHARVESCERGGGLASRTLLHLATDWPGHFPNAAATIRVLLTAGADVNSRFIGRHRETPLHWAASSDDVEVLDALLDGGADLEASGGVIGNGTPLADAVAFGQWSAARRLVERGAQTTLWQASALGLDDRVEGFLSGNPAPTPADVTNALWCACHGGQRSAAESLLARGAELNRIGHDGLTPLDAAQRSGAIEIGAWLRSRGARSAGESPRSP
jgi:ankyrin repeat protein